MDELPELAFEQVLSCLSLQVRLKARAVSRRWYHKINSFRVQTLCYSVHPMGFIFEKSRWVSGAFAHNFISSTRFVKFFDTFGQTILSSLKHLRLCDINLYLLQKDLAAFARTLNSFDQLEELDIIRARLYHQDVFNLNLNLPLLTSLQLEEVHGIQKLTLDTPRMREVKVLFGSNELNLRLNLRLEIVHGESVERLLIDQLEIIEVKKLKNLQYLYTSDPLKIDPTFLSSLQQLKEIHVENWQSALKLFKQKQRSGRADLKIYLWGLLLNGPRDPAMYALHILNILNRPTVIHGDLSMRAAFVYLAENLSRLADQIHSFRSLRYLPIEAIAPGLEVDLLKRCIRLYKVKVDNPVQDIQRFLDLLKNCKNIVELDIFDDQSQDLFNQLPEHCAVQKLTLFCPSFYSGFLSCPSSDLDFLLQLKHLIHLDIDWSIDSETVRRAFEELPVLSHFKFGYGHKKAEIKIGKSKQFQVWCQKASSLLPGKTVSDLDAAIELIFGKKLSTTNKRKAEALE